MAVQVLSSANAQSRHICSENDDNDDGGNGGDVHQRAPKKTQRRVDTWPRYSCSQSFIAAAAAVVAASSFSESEDAHYSAQISL